MTVTLKLGQPHSTQVPFLPKYYSHFLFFLVAANQEGVLFEVVVNEYIVLAALSASSTVPGVVALVFLGGTADEHPLEN